MIFEPITLYSANLIEDSTQITTTSNTSQITFSEAKQIDAFLIKNTDITSVQVAYKTTAEQESWTSGPTLTQTQKADKFFILPTQITVQIIRLTFNISIDFEEILIVKKLLTLQNILSSYTLDNTFKGSSYYLADGSLVSWQEFVKKKLNLNLSNISQTLLEQIKTTLKNNPFLTYALFGDFDGYFVGEFAPKEPPVYNLNRQNALYTLNLTLLER
ncbi:MAG: hypothetical protein II972_02380 [Elusimicrobiaceae bacterium]|nr:hypothetical protein [Elusimicrobiaceae bacterium]